MLQSVQVEPLPINLLSLASPVSLLANYAATTRSALPAFRTIFWMALNVWASVRMTPLSSTNPALFHVFLAMIHVRLAVMEQLYAHLALMAHICSMDLVLTLQLVLLVPFPTLITANAPIAHLLALPAKINKFALAAPLIFPYSMVLVILPARMAQFPWVSMEQIFVFRVLFNAWPAHLALTIVLLVPTPVLIFTMVHATILLPVLMVLSSTLSIVHAQRATLHVNFVPICLIVKLAQLTFICSIPLAFLFVPMALSPLTRQTHVKVVNILVQLAPILSLIAPAVPVSTLLRCSSSTILATTHHNVLKAPSKTISLSVAINVSLLAQIVFLL